MKNKKHLILLSIIIIVFLLVTGKAYFNVANLKEKNDGNEIGQFNISWFSDGSNNDGEIQDDGSLKLYISNNSPYNEETNPNGGVRVSSQLLFNMGGSVDAPAGSLRIYVPRHIFRDRNGSLINEAMIVPLVEYPGETGSGFNYRYEVMDGEEYLLLENYKTISSSYAFESSFTWIAPNPVDISNNFTTSFKCLIKVDLDLDGNVDVESESNELSLVYQTETPGTETNSIFYGRTLDHTDAELNRVTNVYREWQSGWNEALKPQNHQDYVYSLWYSYGFIISATQPYSIKFNASVLDSLGGEVVGYCFSYNCFASSPDALQTEIEEMEFPNPSPDRDLIGHYSFIIKYPKSTILDGEKHELIAGYEYTIMGIDGEVRIASGEIYSDYGGEDDKPDDEYIVYPFEAKREIRMSHSGGHSYKGAINSIMYSVNDYLYRIGSSNGWMNASTGSIIDVVSTLKDGGDPDEPEDYFVNKWTYNNVVDTFFMGSGSNYKLLEPGDYEIKEFNASYTMYKYENKTTVTQTPYNTITITGWQPEYLSYDEYEPAKVYYKDGNDEWIYYVSILKTGPSVCTFTYVTGEEESKECTATVSLPSGALGLKLSVESNKYMVDSTIYYNAYGKNTEHVKELIGDKEAIYLYALNTVYSVDKNGTVHTDFETPNNGLNVYEEFKVLVDTADIRKYGELMKHSFSNSYYTLIKKGKSNIKNFVEYTNDPSNRRVIVDYTSYAYEWVTFDKDVLNTDTVISSGALKEQTSGTFYNLLPLGVGVDRDSLVVQTFNTNYDSNYSTTNMYAPGRDVSYELTLIDNYHDTGRTMMIVSVSMPPGMQANYKAFPSTIYSGFSIKFRSYYSWKSIYDYGSELTDTIAYKSGVGALSEGYADDASGIRSLADRDLFVDLDNDGNNSTVKDTIYSQVIKSFSFNTASDASFEVDIKVPGMSDYGNGKDEDVKVSATGLYSYRLRYVSQRNVMTTGLVLYDVLEDYSESSINQWKGRLLSIDVSQPLEKNFDPVIYYSTKKDINLYEKGKSVLDNGIPEDADLNNGEIWSTVAPDDLSKVTAIAVDLSKTKTGANSLLNSEESVVVKVNMQAPYDNYEDNIKNDAKALNSAWWYGNTKQTSNAIHQNFSVYEFTKIGMDELPISVKLNSIFESGTKENPRAVAIGDKILYDLVVSAKDNNELVSNIKIEDVIPNTLGIDLEQIGYYIEGEGDRNNYVLAETDGVVNTLVDGDKVTFSISEMLSGQKIHLLIPTIVSMDANNKVIENAVIVTNFNNYDTDLLSNSTYHEVATGSIKITKKVKGIIDNSKFKMKVIIKPSRNDVDKEVLDYLLNSTYSNIKFNNGEATIELADNDYVLIEGLPNDYEYEVIEEDYLKEGYKTTYSHGSGYIDANEVIDVQVINSTSIVTNPKTSKYIFPTIVSIVWIGVLIHLVIFFKMKLL